MLTCDDVPVIRTALAELIGLKDKADTEDPGRSTGCASILLAPR